MIEPAENKFKGKCPLCGGKLLNPLDPAITGNEIKEVSLITSEIVCEKGYFHCKTSDWEAAWSKQAAALNTALAILSKES